MLKKNTFLARSKITRFTKNYFCLQHIANPRSDEWSNFVHTQQELKQHAAEREEDSSLAGSGAPLR